jgi:hypothetical protein
MTIRTRLLAGLLSFVLATGQGLPAVLPQVLVLSVGGMVLAEEAWARAGSRSSGGYSRPSPRTPSFAAPSAPRTPSTSGGYARPGTSAPAPRAAPAPSAGDQALSRQRAAEALRQQQAPPPRQAAPAPAPGVASPGRPPSSQSSAVWTDRRTPSTAPAPAPNRWYAQQGWSAPGYAQAAPRSFGLWDGLFLWFMLDNLTRPGTTDFFRGNRNDPGLQHWRAQADAMARDNTELRGKLAELDARTATAPSALGPADTGWVEVPAGIPPELATAAGARAAAASEGIGLGGLLFAGVLLGGAVGLAWWAMRRRKPQGGQDVNRLQSMANMARNAVAPEKYAPTRFRVGMVLTADLSPFILAAGATRVTPPAASPKGMMTVAAVGRLDVGSFVRLHLDDRKSLFQLHLDAAGQPDECRYFALFDEVTPADAGEWDVWLHPSDGLIGWPEFQTRDGKTYARIWSPGGTKVAPVAMTETIATAEGSETIRLRSMLYGAATGLPAPAPPTEFILVSAVEREGAAWVELRAGIDINPATLELT